MKILLILLKNKLYCDVQTETNLNTYTEEDSVLTDQDLPPVKLPLYILCIGVIRMLLALGYTLATLSSILTQLTMFTFTIDGFSLGLGSLIGFTMIGLIFLYLYPQSIYEINRSYKVWSKRKFRVYTMIVMSLMILATCFAVVNDFYNDGDYMRVIIFIIFILVNAGLVVFDGTILSRLKKNKLQTS